MVLLLLLYPSTNGKATALRSATTEGCSAAPRTATLWFIVYHPHNASAQKTQNDKIHKRTHLDGREDHTAKFGSPDLHPRNAPSPQRNESSSSSWKQNENPFEKATVAANAVSGSHCSTSVSRNTPSTIAKLGFESGGDGFLPKCFVLREQRI